MAIPLDIHWIEVKRIFRYLSGALHHGILIKKSDNFQVHAYIDSDWPSDRIDSRCQGGYIVYLGGNLISWSPKKQPTVSKSSCEAEFRSLANTTQEVIWIQTILQRLEIDTKNPTLCLAGGFSFFCVDDEKRKGFHRWSSSSEEGKCLHKEEPLQRRYTIKGKWIVCCSHRWNPTYWY